MVECVYQNDTSRMLILKCIGSKQFYLSGNQNMIKTGLSAALQKHSAMELEPAAKLMLKRDLYIAREFSSEVRCELLYSCTKKIGNTIKSAVSGVGT